MTARTTLTKSLHTVSVVVRVAALYPSMTAEDAAIASLTLLGHPLFDKTDATFAKCVKAVSKARGVK